MLRARHLSDTRKLALLGMTLPLGSVSTSIVQAFAPWVANQTCISA